MVSTKVQVATIAGVGSSGESRGGAARENRQPRLLPSCSAKAGARPFDKLGAGLSTRRGACAAQRRGAVRHRVKDSQWISTEPSSRVGPKSLPRAGRRGRIKGGGRRWAPLILRPIAVAVAALLILLPLGPAPADRAKALIGARRFDEAVGVLRPLVRGERVDAGLLFLFGLAAIEAAQRPGVSGDARGSLLDEAIAAFHTMLVKRPGLIRGRLELARAFFLKD